MGKKRSLGKKLVIAASVLVLVVIGSAAAGIIYLKHYLNTEGFRGRLEGEIREKAGVELEIGDLSASIFKGFTVREVTVASPAQEDPALFSAAEIVLKYNLADLLARKVTVDRIAIVSPRVRLRKDPEGNWILPAGPAAEDKPAPAGPGKKREPSPPEETSEWKIAVDSFHVSDGSAELFTGEDYDPVTVSGLDLAGRFLGAGELSEIEARLKIAGVDLGGERLVEGWQADLVLKGRESLSGKLRSGLAGGKVTGELTADLRDREKIPCRTGLNLEGVEIDRLLGIFAPEAGMEVTGGIFGRVEARGEAGDPESLKASGKVEIREGTISGNQIQNLIAGLLEDEKLKTIDFEEAEADFTVAGRLATLDRLIVHSRKMIFTAAGTVDFARDSRTDLVVGINFHDDLVGDIKVRELRDSFRPSEDFPGYRVFDFKVWGPPDNLKNDFAERLVQRGAVSILKEELLKKDRAREEDPELSEEERTRRREKREKREGAIEEGVGKIFELFGN
ncbi:MAG: AsmA family protein [Candidatus Erginobacter occultus]|nr:AsmA family protein [Candidatus Erginobacter occultus]